jgi:hypothetical protein
MLRISGSVDGGSVGGGAPGAGFEGGTEIRDSE